MASHSQVLVEEKSSVRILTLNRPKQLNALSFQMISRLLQLFLAYEEDPSVKLVVLKGQGRAFCAGGDVSAVVRDIGQGNWRLGAKFFADEYMLNYVMATYTKPQLLLAEDRCRKEREEQEEMASHSQVLVEEKSSVRILTLNRPKQLNALSFQMISRLLQLFLAYEEDPSVKLVILKGQGRAFCAGGDVSAVVRDIGQGNWRLGAKFFADEYMLNYVMATYTKPQVSILNGIVMGGGAGVSVHGPFRIATENTELAGTIKLSAFSSFSLFECRKVVSTSKSSDPGNEEYIGLDDNKYIGDLLAEFKAIKDRNKGEILHCKLVFKKKLFRESDEAVTDLMFVQLSYVQLQHDYLLGNYPVGRDDAAQLCALQILVGIGYDYDIILFLIGSRISDWTSLLERFLPRQIAITRAKREWELDILALYSSMENVTKDDARQQFLRILKALPYGNSVFFSVRKIDDPIGLLPGRIILGINKRGVHFFRPVPKEYLHSAELRDIMQFGSSNTAVFFKMRVAGVLHIFQFETKQGEEICVALQTHINDVMLRRYSKARYAASSLVNGGDISCSSKPQNLEVFISTSKMSYGAIKRVELIIGAPLNAERSDSSTVGWDGPAGYVYQKAYLEFLCSKDKLDAVVEICKALPCVAATNRGANWVSNTAQSDVNAVTCGVFPAKGIIQPTIVD
ncbi:hypothetical protein F2Q70_00019028 [Brassica cretica]|uniref:3-hydroxyisobutyryl-CoA hydrolase n=1 Tax=Brassica cretica TaxID=69181 RepID=A0A8S9HWM8_BRACR|nr:hypothetical protein F2Q70_00019028 [Brassica cretica]